MEVTIYTTLTCPYCRRVKDFLKANKINFEEIDVTKSREAIDRLIEKSGQIGVPVIEIDGEIIVGADIQKLKEKLKSDENDL